VHKGNALSALEELAGVVQTVGGRVGPAVVAIGRRQRGSGVVVSDGQVITNAHNLRGDEVTVTFADGRRERGTVAGVDLDGDLAVISVATTGIEPVAWGSGETPALGTVVLGVAPAGGGSTRVTVGFVSAVERAFRGPGGRRIGGSIEHTAPLAPGSSGGPIVDVAGGLLGINTNRIGDGFYLAVPADATLRDRVGALARGESPTRLRLGVAVAPSHVARRLRRSVGLADRDGVLVRGVEEGSAAEAVGVAVGDLIVALGDRPVADMDDLYDALGAAAYPFELAIVRGAEELTLTVTAPTAEG
jgi:S1-C subfamily serine protease